MMPNHKNPSKKQDYEKLSNYSSNKKFNFNSSDNKIEENLYLADNNNSRSNIIVNSMENSMINNSVNKLIDHDERKKSKIDMNSINNQDSDNEDKIEELGLKNRRQSHKRPKKRASHLSRDNRNELNPQHRKQFSSKEDEEDNDNNGKHHNENLKNVGAADSLEEKDKYPIRKLFEEDQNPNEIDDVEIDQNEDGVGNSKYSIDYRKLMKKDKIVIVSYI